MDYGMIGKIEKARRYAEEPERITFKAFNAHFRGSNSDYAISLGDAGWSCTCAGFHSLHICPHVMALEKLFRPMLKRDPLPYAPGQNVVSDSHRGFRDHVEDGERQEREDRREKHQQARAGAVGDRVGETLDQTGGDSWMPSTD